jgi:S1-C subfamily serine protease
VAEVEPGSPALAAGVLCGDIVREVDVRIVRTLAEFEAASRETPPGRVVTILVQRSRKPLYVVVTP